MFHKLTVDEIADQVKNKTIIGLKCMTVKKAAKADKMLKIRL